MPRCGGCEGVCRCAVQGTDAITVDGSGQPATPYVVDLDVSPDVGNSLEVRANGVFVGSEIVAGTTVGTGLDGDGTGGDPLILAPPSCAVSRAASLSVSNNVLTAIPFVTIDHEGGGDFVDLTDEATRLTIPLNGVWLIEAEVAWSGFLADTNQAGEAERRNLVVTLNGTAMTIPLQDYRHPIPDFPASQQFQAGLFQRVSRVRELDAGQYLTAAVTQVNTGALARSIYAAYLSATYIRPKA